jgi:hypothetical protein
MTPKRPLIAATAAALAASAWLAFAQHRHDPAAHGHVPGADQRAPAADRRVPVAFPPELREHMLASMRSHLLALQEIQERLAKAEFDQAADVAERRLGMSSLTVHGAEDVGPYMPKGMQEAGTAMHRSASRFSIAALDAAATNDLKPALSALAEVTASCVACHAAYRLE